MEDLGNDQRLDLTARGDAAPVGSFYEQTGGAPDRVMEQLLAAVSAALEAPPSDRRSPVQRTLQALKGALDSSTVARSRPGGLAVWQQRKVSQAIEGELSAGISTARLAAIARLSASHFTRAFKSSFGRSPHAYVTWRRVERAKSMMLATRESLCQISLECGFSDQAHLSRVFRRAVGQSPSLWRRTNLSG